MGLSFAAVIERGKVQITACPKFAGPIADLNRASADPEFLGRSPRFVDRQRRASVGGFAQPLALFGSNQLNRDSAILGATQRPMASFCID